MASGHGVENVAYNSVHLVSERRWCSVELPVIGELDKPRSDEVLIWIHALFCRRHTGHLRIVSRSGILLSNLQKTSQRHDAPSGYSMRHAAQQRESCVQSCSHLPIESFLPQPCRLLPRSKLSNAAEVAQSSASSNQSSTEPSIKRLTTMSIHLSST